MFGSWTLDSFAIGSIILFAVPIIACIHRQIQQGKGKCE